MGTEDVSRRKWEAYKDLIMIGERVIGTFKWIKYVKYVVLVSIILNIACSRTKVSDQHFDYHSTAYTLSMWGEELSNILDSGIDLKRLNPKAQVDLEFAKFLFKHRFANASDCQDMLTDWWGNKLTLQITDDGDNQVVKIISNGRNLTYENGDGDDLFIELKKGSKQNKAQITVRTIDVNGAFKVLEAKRVPRP